MCDGHGGDEGACGETPYEKREQFVLSEDSSATFREQEGGAKFAATNGSAVKSLFGAVVSLRLVNEKKGNR